MALGFDVSESFIKSRELSINARRALQAELDFVSKKSGEFRII
jgi:hypothetical protein